jgi:hypothetical protein
MAKLQVGDHVQLKGVGLGGYSGTIVKRKRLGTMRVRLDDGQLRAGSNMITVSRMNIAKPTQN